MSKSTGAITAANKESKDDDNHTYVFKRDKSDLGIDDMKKLDHYLYHLSDLFHNKKHHVEAKYFTP